MTQLLRHRAIAVATGAFLVVSAVAAGLAFAGSDLLADRRVAVPLLLALLGVGVLALLGWAMERTRREELEITALEERLELEGRAQEREGRLKAEQDRLQQELADAAADRARREEIEHEIRARLQGQEKALQEARVEHEARLDQAHQELVQERRLRARVEQSRRDEKEWALHLRSEVMRLQGQRGVLGDTTDVRRLVLRTAMTLVGAHKGLLLSRGDEDRDRLLDLICHEGFDADPAESAVAQRFAREVLERDRTVREEDEADLARERRTPADEEIRNLLAIPIYIADRFSGVVVLANKDGGFSDYDDDVLLALGDHAGAVLDNARLQHELRTSYVGTVRVLADAIEAKDRFLRGHSEDVSAYVAGVADRVGLDPRQREELVYSSLLHDVGKLGISERILMKPAELTPEERSLVQLHPRIGVRLVQQVPALKASELAILHHHERWDGQGYPAGLRGEEIPLEARIIAVADAFGAMTSDRPYRARMSPEEACSELEANAATQFDPVVVRHFVEEVRRRPPAVEELDALHEALADPEIDARRDDDAPVLGTASFGLTDNLTLLYGRRYLHEAADAEARRASGQNRAFAVILLELAGLDEVNRREGYAEGDRVIQRAARALQRETSRVGGTASRYGGHRLAAIVPGGEEQARELVAAVEAGLEERSGVRSAFALWRQGDSGDDVVARARAGLAGDQRPSAAPAAPAWDHVRSWPPAD